MTLSKLQIKVLKEAFSQFNKVGLLEVLNLLLAYIKEKFGDEKEFGEIKK
jgi:hypothetical protein